MLAVGLIAAGWVWNSHRFPPYSVSGGSFRRFADYAVTVALYPLVGLLVGGVLLWLTLNRHSAVTRLLRAPTIRGLGTLSFGIYMWHPLVQPVTQAMDLRFVTTMPRETQTLGINLLFLLYLALTISCASLSYFLVESPALRWKERFAATVTTGKETQPRDGGRNPGRIFPAAVTASLLLAVALSAELLHPPDTRRAVAEVAPAPPPAANTPRPPIPGGLALTRPTGPIILLKWRRLSNIERIERYEIEIQELGPGAADRSRVVGAPASNDSYGFSGLYPESAYSFRIRSCRESSCSAWSVVHRIAAQPDNSK